MRVGFIGLGKLGLPCAVAIASRNHDVMGYDVRPERMRLDTELGGESGLDATADASALLRSSTLRFGALSDVVAHAEIVFLAIQTPHQEALDGTRPMTRTEDFDYSYLEESVRQVEEVVTRPTVLVVMSTVLPGTIRSRIVPLLGPHLKLVYNPSFIAMGTTMKDYVTPELVLLGIENEAAVPIVERFYRTITHAPLHRTSIENAELIKTLYNTFICMKINFANCAMELCHRTPGASVDEVMRALSMAHRRLISPAYLSGGMGDGGGCHPRDNMAMSWLADKLSLSCDPFRAMMSIREKQTGWLADMMEGVDLPKAILGYSFKAGTAITAGSPALLLKNILEARGYKVWCHDPVVEGHTVDLRTQPPRVYLIGTRHEVFRTYRFPSGSVVIDPWRFLDEQPNVWVIPVGVGPAHAQKRSALHARDLARANA